MAIGARVEELGLGAGSFSTQVRSNTRINLWGWAQCGLRDGRAGRSGLLPRATANRLTWEW